MIYFDSAATTLQKPAAVRQAVNHALLRQASPGRGGHRASMRAAETAYQCREAAAKLFRVPDPAQIVFTHNATHALNMAIKSLVGPGDRVVISGFEHNSVLRPLHAIGAEIVVAQAPLFSPEATMAAFDAEICAETKLVVCNHVSNVFGYILPIEGVAALCNARGVPLVIDASQSAGVLEIDAVELGADYIAMPGHKGLYGPQGTGILICRDAPERTILEGGTGSEAMRAEMPEGLPDRLEAGTPNMPGISGLLAGLRFVSRCGEGEILHHERHLLGRLREGLSGVRGLQLYAAEEPDQQTGVLSFRVDGLDCEAIAAELGTMDVGVRAGLHCSPLAHKSAGTIESGTVRVSFSAFNTEGEVERFLRICEKTRKKLQKSEIT
ncbi:MAG: aminotransferase class V-fold PLP-dependent enzyme [Oscillospiraceae bacterium]|nr:aminotransferase class V-fold PLP-dependent enzyme [Oscillospiraceae bacterium]